VPKIKYSFEEIKYMSYFESITKTKVKDCFVDHRGQLTFVVNPGDIIKAVGKNATNAKKLDEKLKRKVRIVEYSPDIVKFTRNLMHPNKDKSVEFSDGVVSVLPSDLKSRGYMIGKGAMMLRTNQEVLQRYFPEVQELRILQVSES